MFLEVRHARRALKLLMVLEVRHVRGETCEGALKLLIFLEVRW